jgi:hypothetical protein
MVYHAGEWLLPLLAFWLQDWRLLNLAIAAICCITGLLLLPFPESPRWLLLKGQQQEARRALTWLAALNGRQLPDGLDITHSVELTAAADVADDDASENSAGSRSLQQRDTDVTVLGDGSAVQTCRVETTVAPLVTQSNCIDIDSDTLPPLDSDCTALLPSHDSSAFEAKQAQQGQQLQQKQQQQPQRQKDGSDKQQSSGLLSLFSHALLARYFVVTALLCTVMAICFYTINLATDSLQVRGSH